ncbi:IgGFc-binding protein-like [Brachyhypopomus gauderio]|uniref:IgGFc-binding protein-like n=1 Tax=Brachyhypopomus gauderio TaxID=698409 RepID=UPI004042F364
MFDTIRSLFHLGAVLLLLLNGGLIRGQQTGPFYPFGAGDIVNSQTDDGSSPAVSILQPFIFFGKIYNQIFVNNNGDVTFDQPFSSFTPSQFPARGGRDIVAPFWTDIDNRVKGVISYQQYTSGSVLTQATQDINLYFPQLRFRATWVFVATWDRVAYYPNSGTETSFQVILISDGNLSLFLINYGSIALRNINVQAGYDTSDSRNYFSIPGSFENNYTSFTNSTNVNVRGRWAFRVDQGSQTCLFNGHTVLLDAVFWTDASCQQRCTCSSRGLQCSSQPCTFSQVCRQAAFQYSCQNIQRQTCTISGDPHYYTFDNQIFHFQGTCTYVLSEVCGRGLPYYRIEGKNDNRGSTRVSWTRLVRVFVYNEQLELEKGHQYQAEVNGSFAATPFSLHNGSIQVYQSGFSVAISTDFGLVVTYDANHYVTISVPYGYQNATCGLCGNFNHRPEDDFRTPSGQILSSDQDFANSWKVPEDTDPACLNTPCSGLTCADCTAAQNSLYRSATYCGILANTSGPFATCHSMLAPQTFIENCVYDLCVGGGYQPILCKALNVYASQCQQQGIQLGQWRRPGLCEIPCPAHSHLEIQGTSCPATCSNPSAPVNCPLPNQESCICDAGYVLSAGECVPQANCGCTFEGLYYAEGQSVVLGADCGRQCVCSSRVMSCQNHQCNQQETCGIYDGVRGCRPTGYSTCMVEGLGTYRTFDGVTFSYAGACGLTLTRIMRPSQLPNFAVTVQKLPRGLQDFTRVLRFEAEGTQVSIEMAEGGKAQVNGQVVALPFIVTSGRILIYHSSVKSIIVETPFGVIVRADWPNLIRITAPSTYNGTLGGLCGNLNSNRADEFYSPVGILLNNSREFGDSWRNGPLSGYCVDSAYIQYYQNHSQFTQNCSIMVSAHGPFAQCHSSLDPRQWVADCTYSLEQTGGAREALCEALRGYSLLCQQNNIAVGEWRNITNCEFLCPANSHYELCGTSCPATCPSLSFPFLCSQHCQEGCQCNNGLLLSGDRCVPPTGCGCLHEGRYRQGGEHFWYGEQCQSQCVCDGTTSLVRCVSSSCREEESCRVVGGELGCHPQPHATCSTSGDPHYTSFDGRKFDFQGTCRYILATVCNDSQGLPYFQVSARNEPWNRLPVSITVDVYVIVSGYMVHISRNMHGAVKVDNETRNLPVLLDSGRVSIYSSGLTTFITTNFGLSVSYDGSWVARITVPGNYSGATCGLCGNFNGQMSDDFLTRSGALETSASQFGASWRVENDTVCSDGCGDSCSSCPDQTRAQTQCEIIRDRQGPFSFCQAYVDPQAYFNDCVFDVCLSGYSNDVLCRSIQTYVSACHSANATVYPWRQNSTCRMDCPVNSHYELCGTDCGHTCASSTDAVCESTCSEGCFCDEGFMRSGGLCVPVDQCGCLYDGLYFHLGEQFWTPGCSQHCECSAPNELSCVSTSCSPSEECAVRNGQRGCYSQMSSCMVWGDSHYLTFDGALTTFQGTCSYEISHTCGFVGNSDLGFRVVATNINHVDMDMSSVSVVDVWLHQGAQHTQISIGQNGRVKVDGNIVNSSAIQIGRLADVHQELNFVLVNASSELLVHFVGSSTLSVRLGPSFHGSVCGMCGNNNGDQSDDKALPSGALASNDTVFGNSWKSNSSSPGCGVNDPPDPPPCLLRVRYSDRCRIITNTTGPFHLCHGHVNPAPYFTSCVYDLCAYPSTNHMLCSAVGAYEAACTLVQVQLSDWRSDLSCWPLYPFGAGDIVSDGSSRAISFVSPFVFFGKTYSQTYVNDNGYLTFGNAWDSCVLFPFPRRGVPDIIAPFWTCLFPGRGVILYRHYTSGSVLNQATQDVIQYFPQMRFRATWVFVATWDRVAYYPNSTTETSFQVVLISDGHFSFILMNYGQIAPSIMVQAGYGTDDGSFNFSIPGSFQYNYTSFTYSTNVNVRGRWAFRVDQGSQTCLFNGRTVLLDAVFWTDASCQQRCTCSSRGLQCSSQPCTFSQVCRQAAFQYSCQNIQRQTCTISGDPHFYTFDNQIFHFQGTCTYVLSEVCGRELPYYRIEGKNDNRGSTRVSWTRLVRVFVYNEQLELEKGHQYQAKVNGSFAATPFSLHKGSIQVYQSGFSVAISTDFGLVVTYDANHYVTISVPYEYQNATCGLCGNFNHRPEDDFRTPSGQILSSDQDFANSWKVPEDTDPACLNTPCSGLTCADCTSAQNSLYRSATYCGILANTSGPFATCHSMLAPQTFIENCVYDLCVGGGYQPILCQALNVYASQCQRQGIQLGQWRRPGLCEIPCPVHSHLEIQGTSCPATCSNPSAPVNCPLPNQESCICDAGYVLSAGECVPQANCGCTFEGLYYAEGQSVVLGADCGRQCVCSSRVMSCQNHQCGRQETCGIYDGVRGCRPTSYSTCMVEGLGTYRTFDGVTFSYAGACGLTLTRIMRPSQLPNFAVTMQKLPRGLQDFTRVLTFEAEGTQVSIEMAEGGTAQVNGQMVALPFIVASGRILIYHSSVKSIVMETPFGVTVRADWPDLIRITAPSTYNGTLGGLCGNLNGNRADEFYSPVGILLNNSREFGDSWRNGPLSGYCVDSAYIQYYQNHSQFTQNCSIMASARGPFAQCHSSLDPRQWVADCTYSLEQTGGAREALCKALRGYSLLCQQNNIVVGEWRNITNCEFLCPANSHYELCGTSCPATCPSLSFPFLCSQHCQEGCQCNNGLVLSGDRCVPPTGCGCLHEGRYRQWGERFWYGEQCQSQCVCDGTTSLVRCVSSSCSEEESCSVVGGELGCHPQPRATCSASGDPHYTSFDGRKFDFQGTCQYILATVCNNTQGLPYFQVSARNEPWNRLPVSITVDVYVIVSGYMVHISRNMHSAVKVDNETRNLPVLLDSGRVSIYSSGLTTFITTDFGLSVSYDGSWVARITVPGNYSGTTCGLCGNFNGQMSDDFLTRSGALETSASQFGASWRVENDTVCSDGCGDSCSSCPDQTRAQTQCKIIRDRQGPFSFCQAYVDPQAYFNDCVFDVCLSGYSNDVLCLGLQRLCRSIQTYVSACHSANATVYPWRQNSTCRMDCPVNSHYELCGKDCGHTCASSTDAVCESTCSEGCFCDEGFMRSGGLCVPVDQCGCLYDGLYFHLGEQFWTPGCSQHCECSAPNELSCVSTSCSPSEECAVRNGQRGCYSQMSSCMVWEDSHYLTFDGALTTFQGTCSYEISHTCGFVGNSDLGFRVVATNINHVDMDMSSVSVVDVWLHQGAQHTQISIGQNGRVKVDGNVVNSSAFQIGRLADVHQELNFVLVNASNELLVHFVGSSTLSVRLGPSFHGSVCGMCGNNNGDPSDDKTLPSGALASNDTVFGNSWKSNSSSPGCGVNDPPDPPPCPLRVRYSDRCSIITNTTGPFHLCHGHVNPAPYFTSCVYDLCAYPSINHMLCSAVGAYEAACTMVQVQISDWRSDLSCWPLYPFGAGDIVSDGSSRAISFVSPFVFFGKTYSQTYVNDNGYLTFGNAWDSCVLFPFPRRGVPDIIAPFWTCLFPGRGVILYRHYTSGSVLNQATKDVIQYFPQMRFRATWVFVATWDRVAYYPNSTTETSFQVVLISDGHFSFILMNYGQIAPSIMVQAGYGTDDGSFNFSIPGSFQYNYTSFTYSTNVNVRGRWAFRVDQGSQTCLFNGRTVLLDAVFWTDASCQQRCTCSSRGLQCSSQPCTFSQVCRQAAFQYSCQNVQRQTCTISGDPHYYTFDNQIFHFQGTCTYILSEVCGRGLPYYRIEGKNDNRGSTLVSWTRLVRVFVYNEQLELEKGHQYQAKVNGSFAATPFSLHNGSIQVYQSGFSVAISTDFGLVVTYDANHYVTISVPYEYQNATCGLCGNFNHRPEDDFRTPSGQILSSDQDFANSWKVPEDTDPACLNTPCSGLACAACTPAQSNLYRSATYCGLLANTSGPFATCHSRLAPQTFIENCVYDLCVGGGYQPILCQALNVYASQCQQQGIQLGQWRRPGLCEIPCPVHSHLEIQGTSCPATCSNPSALTLTRIMRPSQLPNFAVTVQKLPRGLQDFTRVLRFEAEGTQVSIEMAEGGKAQVNGQVVAFPFIVASGRILIYHSSVKSIIMETPFGVTVRADWPDLIRITAPSTYNGTLGGLCGNLNGNRADEFYSPVGILLNNSREFGDSWRNGPPSGYCVDSAYIQYYQNHSQFTQNCSIMASAHGPFAQCHSSLDPRQWVADCTYSLQQTGGAREALCEALRGYSLLCQQNNIAVGEWRNITNCEFLCPANSHYELCGTSCPATCPSLSFPFLCTQHCQEGCQCNNGLVLSGDRCVPPTGCGCLHEGRYRQWGERFWYGEQCQSQCVCDGTTSLVRCVSSSCSEEESCSVVGGELGCHPQPRATCSASGDPHYTSFDGRKFDFQGTCQYILATVCNNTQGLPYFQVSARNEPWNRLPVSITVDVYVIVSGYMVHISRNMHSAVKVDNETRNLPVLLDSGRVSIYSSGLTTFITTDFGLSVSYDGSWVARITVPGNYSGTTCGLCGNFNGQMSDDFLTRSGALETSASQFGASWRVENDTVCSDGCGDSCSSCPDQTRAQTQCKIIRDRQGPFSFCQAYVDPQAYFNDCVFDVCLSGYSNDVLCLGLQRLCRSIQTYVSACHSANATVYPWRQNSTCRMDCPVNSHYELCGKDCGHTCASSTDAVCESTCSEGCFCDEGFMRSGGLCVPVDQCGCLYDGLYFHLGEQFWTPGCSQHCECSAPNELSCVSTSCSPSEECAVRNGQRGCYSQMSSCMVWEDSHYLTFDGALTTFQGTCSYEISHTCGFVGNSDLGFRVVATNINHVDMDMSSVSVVDVWLHQGAQHTQISIGQNGRVKVDGNVVNSSAFQIGRLADVHQELNFVLVNASNELLVHFVGSSTLSVRLGPSFHGSVCGMCGNNNGDPSDDKTLPSGALASNDTVFGNSWKSNSSSPGCGVNDPPDPPPCPLRVRYSDRCSIITNTTGPFHLCHGHVNPAPYFTSCVYDLCAYPSINHMLCSAVGAYEAACTMVQVQISDWRSDLSCWPLYPFGAGDIVSDGSSRAISFVSPFVFFGKTYSQTYVNDNGYLTFGNAWDSCVLFPFPRRGVPDIIAPFWTCLFPGRGVILYRHYTSGSVLNQATKDVIQYFPQMRFRATWVFVATWDRVAYYPNSTTETSFQVVLISDGHFSFILMNYGQIAPSIMVQAGYGTDDGSFNFSIPGSFQYNYTSFTYSTNVNVRGRWAFRVDQGSQTCLFNGRTVLLDAVFWTDASCQQRCTCSSRGLQCSSQPCTFSQVCRQAAFQYSCQNVQRQTCTISGDPHYYTFDNQIFHFQGTCTYILSEVCGRGLPYYRIEGKNDNRGSTLVSWTRLVRVFVYNEQLELEKGHQYQAKVNGSFAATPFSLHNGSIQVYQSGFSVAISTDFGLVVTYDANHYVTISVPYEYQNATCGLCGNFNHRPEDDFRTPSGQILSSDQDFANSWKVPEDTDPACLNTPCSGLACAACTPAQSNLYRSATYCGLLANTSGPFATCHSRLAPQTFIENCVYDLCVGGGYQPILCQALNVYASQCQQQGIQLGQWRRPGLCEIPCPVHSHLEIQGTSCPATCSNPSAPVNCPLPNQESCICDAGYVLSAGECVPQANCGCTFEGLYYAEGQSVVLGADCGRQCVCSSRVMSCQNHQCGRQETCGIYDGVRGCRPTSYSTCMVEGLGTYRTFDGVTFSYAGACGLTLTRIMRPSQLPNFAVTVQKLPRGLQDFTRVLRFEAEGTQVSIEMAEGGKAQVNGQVVAFPFIVASGRILIYHSSVKSIIMETPFGVTVRADWPDLIRITAPSTYNGTLGGLCGNLNGNRADEFYSPVGILLNNSREFGDSWRNGPPSGYCVDSAYIQYYQNHSQFTQNCSIMASAHGPFAQCHSSLDPRQWVADCTYSLQQTGGAREALCEALRGYSLLCQQNNIAVGEWRNITNCEFLCPANSHYELCGTSCPATCPSLSFPFLCTQHCQEGCQCNNGLVLSGDRCVPPTGCGCLHEGRYRQWGEHFWYGEQCQSQCVCDGTTSLVRCVPSSCREEESCRVVGGELGCHPQPHATCSASGDPHYTSFDGRKFDFQGTCRYILATVCNDTKGLPYFQVSARNEPWNRLPVSITVDVYVIVSGYMVHISRNMHGAVKVDNETRNLPVLLDSGRVSIYSSGLTTFITTDFGLSVSYDGSWVARITVPGNYSGTTCGLCGNFNGQTSDDFLTRSGALETSASQFGASWRVENDTVCSDGCGDSCSSCPDQTRAQTQCEIIRDKQGPFSFCHDYVDPQAYFNDCVFDVCLTEYSNDVLCRSIQTYVSACHSANATVFPWRQNSTCRMDCPVNSHYELCGTDCGYTCASSTDAVCERTCSEGCFCDEGFMRSGGLCVSVDQCGCLYDGLYFHLVEQFWTPECSQHCECSATNELSCVSTSCSPSEECAVRNGQRGCYSQMSSTQMPTSTSTTTINALVDHCEEVNCTEDEWCGEMEGVHGCFCNQDDPRPNPETYDAVEVCDGSSGTMSLSRCQLFEAGFSVHTLHLSDPSCRGTVQNGRLVFHFDNDYHICGTNLTANGTHFIYENTIQGGLENLSLPFSCIYALTQTLTMTSELHPLQSTIYKNLPGGVGKYQVRMIPYRDPGFSHPYNGSADVEVDQRIYVAVLVQGVDSRQIATVIDSCWATPENDPDYAVRWDLIVKQCPNPDDNSVEVLQSGVSTTAHFSFEMFAFDGYPKVFLHCSIHLCLLQSNNCAVHCYHGYHRAARSVDIHDTSTISMGPFIRTERSRR